MQLREWNVLAVYFIAPDGTLQNRTYVSNGRAVYPADAPNKADAISAPAVTNVYRVVYYPLTPPGGLTEQPPLLVLDVLPLLSVVRYQNHQLSVVAKIYTPLANLPVSWQSELRGVGTTINYNLLKISIKRRWGDRSALWQQRRQAVSVSKK
jgi:hypothetical protein